jgi:hypothetical protein
MSPLVVCIAVVLHRCRRPVDGPDHLDDAPPIAIEIERRPVSPAEVATRRVVPVGEFYDRVIAAAAGLQRVLDRRPSQTAKMALRFFRTPLIQRIYAQWQSERPFPTLAQFVTLCRAFSSGRRFDRLDAAVCAAAVRTLEVLAPGDPSAGRVLVDVAERSFYFVSPRSG